MTGNEVAELLATIARHEETITALRAQRDNALVERDRARERARRERKRADDAIAGLRAGVVP